MKRGRFAPSPSGLMHLGNAFTALLAWLQMRHDQGTFLLRMEDIDRQRSKPEFARQILEDLRWLDIDWDEGPDVGGPYGPYVQSERMPLYKDALDHLCRENRLYPCYCSRADLMRAASAPHGIASEGPVYPGTCRNLSPQEREKLHSKKQPSLRFAMPDKPVGFDDLVMGAQYFPPFAGGDFIVKRSDGMIGYQLAVVVDDASMNITDVLRGADLIDSTPRQILLYEALGLKAPRFAHVPLLLGPDGRRLSKRHGDITLFGLRNNGTAPEKVIGFLAHLSGLTEKWEPLKAAELVPSFDLHKIPRSPVILDEEALKRLFGP